MFFNVDNEAKKVLYKMGFKRFYRSYATQFSMLGVLVVGIILMTILSPYFLTSTNFSNLSVYITITGILAAGQTLILLSGGIDLSQTAAMAVGVMVGGIVVTTTGNALLAILASIATCLIIGAVNTFIITKIRIAPFIATIGMAMVYKSIALISTNASNVLVDNPVYKYIGYGAILGIPVSFWIMIVIYVFIFIFLKYSITGRSMYAVGGNPGASFLAGIKINKIRTIGFLMSGVLVGITSVLWVAQMSAAVPTAGNGLDFDPIIGSIMGGIGFSGGKGTIVGTFIGMCVLTLFANAMALLQIPAFYQTMLKGTVLIIAVGVDSMRGSKNGLGGGMPGMPS